MQPLQRHLLSSDNDKVPVEFIWQRNFPRRDLEQVPFFFFHFHFLFKSDACAVARVASEALALEEKINCPVQSSRSPRRQRFSGVVRVFAVDLDAGGRGGGREGGGRRGSSGRVGRRWLPKEVVEHAGKEEKVKLGEE